MITVNQATKDAWMSEISEKHITITVTGVGTITENDIVYDSFEFSESIISSDSIEFIGCIARKLSFTTNAFNNANLKNKRISVSVKANNTSSISVFSGIIDEAVKASQKGLKSIVAYDDFYRLSLLDASKWWNNLGKTTIYRAFLSFKAEFNLENYVIWLRNGNFPCFGGTKKQVRNFSALDFLKQMCQINGVIGYIDGDGLFKIKHLNTATPTEIEYFRDFEYEDYDVSPINRVVIRNSSDDEGIYYPYSGNNTYIIQGNIFAYDQSASDLLDMAHNILDEIEDIGFKPFSVKHPAYPWLECGDWVSYTDIDDEGVEQTINVMLVSRTMGGSQYIEDTFSAEGEQNQHVFITDLQAQIDDIQSQLDEDDTGYDDKTYRGIILYEFTDVPEVEVLGGIPDIESGIVTEVS